MLDPLVGVGPLRFGMSPEQVQEALGGDATGGVSSGWRRYSRLGVSTIHGPGEELVAVGIDANRGPLVVLEDVVLIARVPSEARADISRLARRHGAKVVLNMEGEPNVPAWGISIGVTQQWLPNAEGYFQRGDAMRTDLLVTGPQLADDPYSDNNVAGWRHNSPPRPGPRAVDTGGRAGPATLGVPAAGRGRPAAVRDDTGAGVGRPGR
ncbi:hypothetical protein ACFQ0M_00235 [Kitasatospora aburaviensis]